MGEHVIKNYLRPFQAASFLSKETGDNYSVDDIRDLAIEGAIRIVCYFNGKITEFEYIYSEDDDRRKNMLLEDVPLISYRFEGYFSSRELIPLICADGFQKIPYPIDIFHTIDSNYRPKDSIFSFGIFPLPSDCGWQPTLRAIGNDCYFLNSDEDLFIPKDDLIGLVDPIKYKNNEKKKTGLSAEKMDVMATARTYARKQWVQDITKSIRIGEMTQRVWSFLLDIGCQDELPENIASLQHWIEDVAPEYARRSGRPKKTP